MEKCREICWEETLVYTGEVGGGIAAAWDPKVNYWDPNVNYIDNVRADYAD